MWPARIVCALARPAIGVTYAAFYDYLNCLEISPCAAWMNSNETYRNGASERAAELNQVYLEIIDEYNFTRFDMAYFDYPIFDVIEYWEVRPRHTCRRWRMVGCAVRLTFLHAMSSARLAVAVVQAQGGALRDLIEAADGYATPRWRSLCVAGAS